MNKLVIRPIKLGWEWGTLRKGYADRFDNWFTPATSLLNIQHCKRFFWVIGVCLSYVRDYPYEPVM